MTLRSNGAATETMADEESQTAVASEPTEDEAPQTSQATHESSVPKPEERGSYVQYSPKSHELFANHCKRGLVVTLLGCISGPPSLESGSEVFVGFQPEG